MQENCQLRLILHDSLASLMMGALMHSARQNVTACPRIRMPAIWQAVAYSKSAAEFRGSYDHLVTADVSPCVGLQLSTW